MDSFLLVGERPLSGSLRNQQVTEGFTPFYNHLDRHKRNYKMSIAKGRNNMLASIEDSASMLNSLVNELDRFYSNKLNDFERKIDLLRIENKNEEPEVICSMCSDWNYAISIYDELFTETKEMLICKVYSYTEKHMSELLSMLKCNVYIAKAPFVKIVTNGMLYIYMCKFISRMDYSPNNW